MITALVVDAISQDAVRLTQQLTKHCPQIAIAGSTDNLEAALQQMTLANPELIFLDVEMPGRDQDALLRCLPPQQYESIIVTRQENYISEALKFNISGFLVKPVRAEDLLIAVGHAQRRIQLKKAYRESRRQLQQLDRSRPGQGLIGIPTLVGFDFFPIQEIVRCEGLQRCTRVVTTSRSDIVSSYNLGKFRELLTPYGFYAPHKSHLLNLRYVRRYLREGTIILRDGSTIPVARSKKSDFLRQIPHL